MREPFGQFSQQPLSLTTFIQTLSVDYFFQFVCYERHPVHYLLHCKTTQRWKKYMQIFLFNLFLKQLQRINLKRWTVWLGLLRNSIGVHLSKVNWHPPANQNWVFTKTMVYHDILPLMMPLFFQPHSLNQSGHVFRLLTDKAFPHRAAVCMFVFVFGSLCGVCAACPL